MKLRNLMMSLGAASSVAAAPAFAQTTIVVDPAVRTDPNAPIVVVTPNNAYVVTPDTVPAGTHYAVDPYGHQIIVDDTYMTAPQRRSIFDSSVDHATGTVTSPSYMGPRDTTGQ